MIRGGRYLALISRQRLGMQTGGSVSRRPALHSWTTVKNFSSSSDPKVAKEDESQSADEEAKEVEIYHKPQGFTIRVMFGISTVNLMYWSSILLNHYWYKGMVIQGIDLAGDPMWGYVGCVATSGLLYFTRHFANHTINRASLFEEGKRLRLQVHTMLGAPGKIYETSAGSAKFLSVRQQEEVLKELAEDSEAANSPNPSFASRIMDSSFVPIKISGVESNLVVDKYGLRDYDQKFAHILAAPTEHLAFVQGKEERKLWRKKIMSKSRKHK